MQNRRTFLHRLSLGGFSLPFLESWNTSSSKSWEAFCASEWSESEYWQRIRLEYSVSANIINLNNGGVSPQPKLVQETFEHYNRMSNEGPSYYMWRILDQGREALRSSLAALAGIQASEIALNRNATEALVTVIMGIPLQKGDEVVLSRWDYPNMINAWKWREKRDGIKLVWVEHPTVSENEQELSERYIRLFSPRTKVVHITHLINWNGQVMPVKLIADKARERGILSIADCAHSFAHLVFDVPALGADFMGTSLHKWLCAPFGSGLLYVQAGKIASLPPMFPGEKPESDDIRKFETLGTRSFPTELAVGRAIDFHESIGSQRKFDRLFYLKDYWTSRAAQFEGVKIHTPQSSAWSGAIALFSIEGWKPAEIESELFKKWGIHSVAIDWENIHGVRITPHVYTLESDLDRLLEGIRSMAGSAPQR